MQMINRKLLFFLADIFPGFFSKNIENAQLFEYYFNILNKNFPLLTSDKYILSHTTTGNSLRNQIKQNFQLAFPLLKSF
jgi:hypothetical protein